MPYASPGSLRLATRGTESGVFDQAALRRRALYGGVGTGWGQLYSLTMDFRVAPLLGTARSREGVRHHARFGPHFPLELLSPNHEVTTGMREDPQN